MTAAHERLNAASRDQAAALLLRCCGSSRWVEGMLERRPFASRADLHAAAGEIWARLGREDHLEAFAHHPRIGDRPRDERATTAWSQEEQSVAARAGGALLTDLRLANAAYEARFGFVFLVCATGKTAAEILGLLEARTPNDPETELRVAAAEQSKITLLRLDKLDMNTTLRGPITSHVLDTSTGRPAKGLRLRADFAEAPGRWATLAHAVTDDDGRVADLLQGARLEAGTYRVTFETGPYFAAAGLPVFYPQVDVVFHVASDGGHYHVPLLLSPFGYSTYRGS
jgi:hydroxyisourate hydrolase